MTSKLLQLALLLQQAQNKSYETSCARNVETIASKFGASNSATISRDWAWNSGGLQLTWEHRNALSVQQLLPQHRSVGLHAPHKALCQKARAFTACIIDKVHVLGEVHNHIPFTKHSLDGLVLVVLVPSDLQLSLEYQMFPIFVLRGGGRDRTRDGNGNGTNIIEMYWELFIA